MNPWIRPNPVSDKASADRFGRRAIHRIEAICRYRTNEISISRKERLKSPKFWLQLAVNSVEALFRPIDEVATQGLPGPT